MIAPEEMENLYVKLAYPKELIGIIFLYNMGVGAGWMVGGGGVKGPRPVILPSSQLIKSSIFKPPLFLNQQTSFRSKL